MLSLPKITRFQGKKEFRDAKVTDIGLYYEIQHAVAFPLLKKTAK